MRRATAVIGSGWGDEGKGLVTDYLCSREEKPGTVVRFNGGAQAGHTVQRPDGHRHVFHHFGSGTLAGWRTYLARQFIINPILFATEGNALGWKAHVACSPIARVTTPWDMLINQAAEDARGARRHGSCGVGINETVERCSHDVSTQAWQLKDDALLRRNLKRVREEWVPFRLAKLGLPPDAIGRYDDEAMTETFMAAVEMFRTEVGQADAKSYFDCDPGPVLFEGAQGLALDQNNRADFPYLTRSNTGLRDVLPLCRAARVETLDAYYVTRAYATRHGQGPLPGEDPGLTYNGIRDATNAPHPYQGSMRYAPLSPAATLARIRSDVDLGVGLNVRARLAVTCLDHVRGDFRYIDPIGTERRVANSGPEELANILNAMMGFDRGCLWSAGPTRSDVRWSRKNVEVLA